MFYKTALHYAVENKNIEIIQLLLSQKNIDANAYLILILFFLNTVPKPIFDSILHH